LHDPRLRGLHAPRPDTVTPRRRVVFNVVVLTRSATILLACLAFGTVAPAALAKSGDAAATKAYIQANYTLVLAARSHLATGQAAIRSLAGQVTSACPLAAVDSPQNYDSEQLSNEVVGAITIAGYHPDAAAMLAFARAITGLHWSNHTLTRMVRTYATKMRGFAALTMPDVCSDVMAWNATGYQTLPASAVQFDQHFYAVDIEAEEVSLRLLAPYENASEASLVHRTKQLEAPLAEVEAGAVKQYTQILDSLKLNP
jgi:hypothetical protein